MVIRLFGYTRTMFSDVVDELLGLPDAELVALIAANELERRRLDAEMAAALAVDWL